MGNEYEIDENGNRRYVFNDTVNQQNQMDDYFKPPYFETFPKDDKFNPNSFQKNAYKGPIDNDPYKEPQKVREEVEDIPEYFPADELYPPEKLRSQKPKNIKEPLDSIRKGELGYKESKAYERERKKPEDNIKGAVLEPEGPPKVVLKSKPVQTTRIINVPMIRTQKKIQELEEEKVPEKEENDDNYKISNVPAGFKNIKKGKYLFPGSQNVLRAPRAKEDLEYTEVDKMEKSNIGVDEVDPNLYKLSPNDQFSQYIFEKINKVRENPEKYIDFLEDAKQNIRPNRYNEKIVYNRMRNEKCKVLLNRGEEAFDEAIDDLGNTKKMNRLIFSPEITVTPPQKNSDIRDPHYLQKKVEQIQKSGINIKAYWKDVVNDRESCIALLLVDDNGQQLTGRRRKIILDPDIKYMGISSNWDTYGRKMGKGEKVPFSCFMTFSKDREIKKNKKNGEESYNEYEGYNDYTENGNEDKEDDDDDFNNYP